ncbi:hypothetical protein ACE1CI_17405 [Aerosakkonemataceae cyanobacterium BLCC-F50]|uniref:Uncharacterized protein n=1 Tax=Floridaenema flaviceps BLCC-F50 TaxID=3153642 RepID=A0ABV4XSI0_9CYAN
MVIGRWSLVGYWSLGHLSLMINDMGASVDIPIPLVFGELLLAIDNK